MRRCEDCRIILDNDVRYCPKCGKDLSANAPDAQIDRSDVDSLLASANLHSIRSEWDAAIADATDALRLDPRNPDIPSLLGTIYEERGMLDEALVWYQMALEINPANEPDKAKLDRVSKRIDEKRNQDSPGSFHVFERRTKAWGIALGAVFALIVILAVVTTLIKGKTSNSASIKPMGTSQSHYANPTVNAKGSDVSENSQPTAETATSTTTTPTGGTSTSLRTAAETYIRSEISSAQGVTETGASIDDVIADPRIGVATVTFTIPSKTAITKDQITHAAIAISRKIFELRQDVKFVTARCMVQSGGAQGTQIVFIGDIAKQSVDALPANANSQQLTAIFSRPWWNPQIR